MSEATGQIPMGSYVKIHHSHLFAGLCLGQVVEIEEDGRLHVVVRVPSHKGSRQDCFIVRASNVDFIALREAP